MSLTHLPQPAPRDWSDDLPRSVTKHVIFGLILVFMPGAGALGLLWLIAAWAVLFGLLLIWVAFKVRTLAKA